jgi:hypothetical protein
MMIQDNEQIHVMTEKDKHRRSICDLNGCIDLIDSFRQSKYPDYADLDTALDGLRDVRGYLETALEVTDNCKEHS